MEIDEELSKAFRINATPIDPAVTPLDKIDAVLNHFYENSEKYIWPYKNEPYKFEKPKRVDLSVKEFESICKKLHKEGYFDYEEKYVNENSNSLMPHYKINFEGELLWLDGSYNAKIKKLEDEIKHKNFMEKFAAETNFQIAQLTFWLSLATWGTLIVACLTLYYQFFR